jgi:hypothetical protein
MNDRSNRYNNYTDKNQRERQNDQFSFSDSWKQNAVELALLGGIVAGATSIGMNGGASTLSQAGKAAILAGGKGLGRYMDRSMGPVGKLTRKLGIGTFKGLQKMPGNGSKFDQALWEDQIRNARSNVDEDEVTRLAKERFTKAREEALYEHAEKGDDQSTFRFYGTPDFYKESVREELFEKSMRDQKAPGYYEPHTGKSDPKNKGKDRDGNAPAGAAPIGAGTNLVGSALAGLGFGAGITAAHGLDRALNGWREHDNKKHEDTYNLGGSFLRKQSSVHRDLYQGIASLGSRVPQSVAAGIGYTGVSLATAAALRNHKDLLVNTKHPADPTENEHNNGPRVIIELGNGDTSQMGSLGMLPHVSQSELGIVKSSGFTNFMKNFGGRGDELRTLTNRINGNTVNYKDEAAEQLKDTNMDDAIKQHFGDSKMGDAKDVLTSKADELRRADFATKDHIEGEVARDRLIGGGIIGTGLLGGALTAHHLKKKQTAGEQHG